MPTARYFCLPSATATTKPPNPDDMHATGTIAKIVQVLKLPDGTVKVLVEGMFRARALSVYDNGSHFESQILPVAETEHTGADSEALRRTLLAQFDQFAKLNKRIPGESAVVHPGNHDNGRLADTIAAHLQLKLEQRQHLLDTADATERMEYLLGQIEGELDILQVEKRIRGKVKRQMDKSQREYYLNEQVKAIQKELGEEDERGEPGCVGTQKIKEAGMTKEAEEKCLSELKKLKMMPPMSAESTVVRNYIDNFARTAFGRKNPASAKILPKPIWC